MSDWQGGAKQNRASYLSECGCRGWQGGRGPCSRAWAQCLAQIPRCSCSGSWVGAWPAVCGAGNKKTQVLQKNNNVLYAYVSVKPWRKWLIWSPLPTMNLKVACQSNRLDPPLCSWLGGICQVHCPTETFPDDRAVCELCSAKYHSIWKGFWPWASTKTLKSCLRSMIPHMWILSTAIWAKYAVCQPMKFDKTCCLMLNIVLASWLMYFKSWVFILFFFFPTLFCPIYFLQGQSCLHILGRGCRISKDLSFWNSLPPACIPGHLAGRIFLFSILLRQKLYLTGDELHHSSLVKLCFLFRKYDSFIGISFN